jgi:hypothetical protein
LARCEQCLRLLSFALWAPGAAGRAASYLADAEGAALLLLRAVLTGVELAEASAADDWWQVRCRPCPIIGAWLAVKLCISIAKQRSYWLQVWAGHSIDVGEAAACRRRALSFLSAAAAATSCLLQHLRG